MNALINTSQIDERQAKWIHIYTMLKLVIKTNLDLKQSYLQIKAEKTKYFTFLCDIEPCTLRLCL